MALSNEIKIARHKAFMTQERFAEVLDVAFSTVNRWEAGKTRPNMTAMKRLKRFCEENKISFEGIKTAWLEKSVEER